jgi:hypothetical protein
MTTATRAAGMTIGSVALMTYQCFRVYSDSLSWLIYGKKVATSPSPMNYLTFPARRNK